MVRYSVLARLRQLLVFLIFASRQKVVLGHPFYSLCIVFSGKVFTQYRRVGGSRTGVLPDFFIGAHAAVQGLPLLTRDVGRYRSYFPTVTLIAPEQES
ncbi:hypothetical protein AT5A_21476 [Agrobacterium tumefaciens 5A]|nr:hypothetical protein AT5A_21476 [Agrobacterium tumefaciens 5A]